MIIVIELSGQPQGKGRPRFRAVETRSGAKFVSAYTPAKTRKYERALAWAGKAAMKGQKPMEGALQAIVTAYFEVPTSWSTKKRDAALAGAIRPTVRPDWDNIGKTLDALNGVVFTDDAIMVDVRVVKFYAECPRLTVEVQELAPPLLQAVEAVA